MADTNTGWSIWDILKFGYGVYRDQNPKDPRQTPIQLGPEQKALFDRYLGSIDNYTSMSGGVGDYITNIVNNAGQSAGYQPTYKSDYMSGEKLPTSPLAGANLFPGGNPFSTAPQPKQPPMGGGGGRGGGGAMRPAFNRDVDGDGGVGADPFGAGGGWSEDYNNNPYNVGGSRYSFGDNGGIQDNWHNPDGPGIGSAPYVPGQEPEAVRNSPVSNETMDALGNYMAQFASQPGGMNSPEALFGNPQLSDLFGSIFGSGPEGAARIASTNPNLGGGFQRMGDWLERNPEWKRRLGLDDPVGLATGLGSLAGINPLLLLGVMGGWKLWQASRKGYFGNQPGRG